MDQGERLGAEVIEPVRLARREVGQIGVADALRDHGEGFGFRARIERVTTNPFLLSEQQRTNDSLA